MKWRLQAPPLGPVFEVQIGSDSIGLVDVTDAGRHGACKSCPEVNAQAGRGPSGPQLGVAELRPRVLMRYWVSIGLNRVLTWFQSGFNGVFNRFFNTVSIGTYGCLKPGALPGAPGRPSTRPHGGSGRTAMSGPRENFPGHLTIGFNRVSLFTWFV